MTSSLFTVCLQPRKSSPHSHSSGKRKKKKLNTVRQVQCRLALLIFIQQRQQQQGMNSVINNRKPVGKNIQVCIATLSSSDMSAEGGWNVKGKSSSSHPGQSNQPITWLGPYEMQGSLQRTAIYNKQPQEQQGAPCNLWQSWPISWSLCCGASGYFWHRAVCLFLLKAQGKWKDHAVKMLILNFFSVELRGFFPDVLLINK